jgi:succinyl-CoA synthetase alpha subunit
MSSSLFTPKNVIVQGITGKHGAFHTQNMRKYGTNIVAGTSPSKGGSVMNGIPVYTTIDAIKKDFTVDASVIFVPAPFAKSAMIEAIDAAIPLIVCITENIPVHDMLAVRQYNEKCGNTSVIIGPNCPGTLTPAGALLGIIPATLSTVGDTAVVSRSGTLTYEAMDLLTRHGFGQKYIIGIGGDMIRGTGFVECLEFFEADPEIKRIIMIGEIGGIDEITAADYIKRSVTKPVYAYIAGHSAPQGVQMGHAGAILGTNKLETAHAKTAYLSRCGATTANSITELITKVQ